MSPCFTLSEKTPLVKSPELEFFVVADENEIFVWMAQANGQPKFPELVDLGEVWRTFYDSPEQCCHIQELELPPGALFTVKVEGADVKNPLGVQIFDGEFWFHRYVLKSSLVSAKIVMEEVTDVQKSNPEPLWDTTIKFGGKIGCQVCSISMERCHKSEGLKHRCGHFISGTALDQYVKYECNKSFEDILQRQGQIFCPLKNYGCTSHAPYTLHQLAPFLSEDTLDLYLKAQQRVSFHRGLHNNEIEEAKRLLEMQLRSLFERPDGTYAAYQCPECGFGPIDHGHCEDLQAHQDEVMDGATKPVDNRCPECGFFAYNIEQWDDWNGKVHVNFLPMRTKSPQDEETEPCVSCIIS